MGNYKEEYWDKMCSSNNCGGFYDTLLHQWYSLHFVISINFDQVGISQNQVKYLCSCKGLVRIFLCNFLKLITGFTSSGIIFFLFSHNIVYCTWHVTGNLKSFFCFHWINFWKRTLLLDYLEFFEKWWFNLQ